MTETIYDDDMECLHIRARRAFSNQYRVWYEIDGDRQLVCCACSAPGLHRAGSSPKPAARSEC